PTRRPRVRVRALPRHLRPPRHAPDPGHPPAPRARTGLLLPAASRVRSRTGEAPDGRGRSGRRLGGPERGADLLRGSRGGGPTAGNSRSVVLAADSPGDE